MGEGGERERRGRGGGGGQKQTDRQRLRQTDEVRARGTRGELLSGK